MAQEQYTEEDRELLRAARAMKDLIDTKVWKLYASIIESQVKTREALLMDSQPGTMDQLTIEHIKGARLGLKLALDTVSLIIADANDLVAREQGQSDGDEE